MFNSVTPFGNELLNLDVSLNGIDVGEFAVPVGITGSYTFTFAFAPIPGPDYRIQIEAPNTISQGVGAVSIALDGHSFATVVSEPSTVSLLIGAGAIGSVPVLRHRRRRS